MSTHELTLFIHILGWVFWLGTDVGVFVGAKYAERADLSAETRLTVLQLSMLLDRFPRFAMPIVWLSGILLMGDMGYVLIAPALAAVLTLIWLTVTWLIVFQPPGSRLHTVGAMAQNLILAAVIFGMGGAGLWLLLQGDWPLWLSAKWLAFALVGITVIVLEKAFMPAVVLFAELAEKGASDELNSKLSIALKPVYPVVLAIYAWTVLAAASGVSKISL